MKDLERLLDRIYREQYDDKTPQVKLSNIFWEIASYFENLEEKNTK